MGLPESDDAMAALLDFVDRIDLLDPDAEELVRIDVRTMVSLSVARALVAALRSYHDPRDLGECGHCGGRRLDDNLICLDCQRPNSVFGQMILERATQYPGDPPGLPA